jgi:hypothetical protein
MHKPHHLTRYTDEPREPQESADPRRWKALAVLSLAQLMLILDSPWSTSPCPTSAPTWT